MHRPTLQRLAAAIAFATAFHAEATTFTVTKTEDTDINNVGTLRWAIAQANSNAGADRIAFNISTGAGAVKLIQPTSPLPSITGDQTLIDGPSQPGYSVSGAPVIHIDGSLIATPGVNGLTAVGDQVGINGIAVTGFSNAGIFVHGNSYGSAIGSVYLGIAPDGVTPAGNGGDGLYISGDATLVAYNDQSRPSVISGNGGSGIEISNAGEENLIYGVRIGTTRLGTQAVPNAVDGITIGGTLNQIGQPGTAYRNLISGNAGAGIFLWGPSNTILNSYIGTNVLGTAALPNGGNGLVIYGDHNIIGSSAANGGNLISGNTGDGLHIRFVENVTIRGNIIGARHDRVAALPNSEVGVYLESPVAAMVGGSVYGEGNTISGNVGDGILVSRSAEGGSTVQVVGNTIGGGEAGAEIGNGANGVQFYEVTTGPGGPNSIRDNLINNNASKGVLVRYSDGVVIRANDIGIYDGTMDAGNAQDGISLQSSTQAVIGGAGSDRNLIGGNDGYGIGVTGPSSASIVGNWIGVGSDGIAVVGNGHGIRVAGALPGLVIGVAGNGNVISGNTRGIVIDDGITGVSMQGNVIGLNPAMTAKMANTETAIMMGGHDHIIGGDAPGAGNIIAGNTGAALRIGDGGGHQIIGNHIGTNAALATGLGNAYGIYNFDASGMTLRDNIIAHNTWSGVRLEGGQNNAVLGNRVFSNGEYNIDIVPNVGPNANDTLDVDQGPNKGQNHPEILSATVSGMNLQFAGKLRSKANTSYRVEYFQATSCHGTGMGQANSYIGHEMVMTDGSGEASLAFLGSNGQNSGFVTATATDPDGNTSEFGNCIAIGAPIAGEFNFMALWQYSYEDVGIAEVVITRSKGASGAVSVKFSTSNQAAPAQPGLDYTATTATLNFAAGETSKTIEVPILADALTEGMEDFYVTLTNPSGGATLGALATGRVVIYDHDPQMIRASIDDATVSEPLNGTANAVFTVTMGADVSTRTIQYATVDATAVAGSDYTATSGSLTFLPGEITKTISVPVKADALLEDDEYFELKLTESDATLQLLRGTGIGAILNSGGAPILFADGFD